MFRRLAERIARGKIFRRHLVVSHARWPVFVTPDAQLSYLKLNGFDRDLVEVAEKNLRETDVVWDVGANVGTFAVAAAAMAQRGSVLAIEPDIWLASILRRTAAEKVYANRIDVLACAVADTCSAARFAIAERGRASNALVDAGGREMMGGVRQEVCVPVLTCDVLLETMRAPDFVKVDVEGAEVLLLEGAKRLLGEVRPKFYLECDASNADRVAEIFSGFNYRLCNPEPGRVLPFNSLFAPA